MPAMPRLNKKTTDIAFNILGVPANLSRKRNKKEQEVNRRLLFEETSRVR